MRGIRYSLLGLTLAFAPVAANACSVGNDYRVPTNLELVEGAEAIVLARAIGEQKDVRSARKNLLVEPITVLKGELSNEPFVISSSQLIASNDTSGFGILSNPYELENAHPLSYIGGCVRYIFPLGTTALFFIERNGDGEWRAAGGPFSRWAEDTLTSKDPWIRLVELYLAIADLPRSERDAALSKEHDRLAAAVDDPVAQLMGADIARQRRDQNQPWNQLMYESLRSEAAAIEAFNEVVGLDGEPTSDVEIEETEEVTFDAAGQVESLSE